MLKMLDVDLWRGNRQVLFSVSLAAVPGTLTVLLGPNGAGKSSVLAVAAGELQANGGTVHIVESTPQALGSPGLARARAALAQSPRLDFDFLVHEVVELGAVPFPEIPEGDLAKLIDSVLVLVDLEAHRNRRYLELSGGEQQRVHVARTFVHAAAIATRGPGLMLLDEPLSSLDPRHQHQMMAGLRQLVRALPLAVVVSLHDPALALAYADKVGLMVQGHMVAQGEPGEVLTGPILSAVYQLPARVENGAISFCLS